MPVVCTTKLTGWPKSFWPSGGGVTGKAIRPVMPMNCGNRLPATSWAVRSRSFQSFRPTKPIAEVTPSKPTISKKRSISGTDLKISSISSAYLSV